MATITTLLAYQNEFLLSFIPVENHKATLFTTGMVSIPNCPLFGHRVTNPGTASYVSSISIKGPKSPLRSGLMSQKGSET